MKNNTLALLLDVDSFTQGNEIPDAYQRPPLKVRSLLDYLESNYGKVTIRLAVADWSTPRLRKFAADLARNDFEMLHCINGFNPKASQAANLLTIKALDLINRYPELDAIAVSSANNELTLLNSYIRSTGRETIFVAQDKNNCPPLANQFDSTIIWPASNNATSSKNSESDAILRQVRNLVPAKGFYLDEFEDEIMDKVPDFKPETFGFSNLYDLLKSIPQYFRIEDKTDGIMIYPTARPAAPHSDTYSTEMDAQTLASLPLADYMYQTRWYIPEGPVREQLLENIYNLFTAEPGLMLKCIDLRSECVDSDMNISDRAWQGTIYSLVRGFCLWERNDNNDTPQAYRKITLHKGVTSLDDFILKYYASLFHKAYSDRPNITAEEMTQLMFPEDMEGHLNLFKDVLALLAAPQHE